MSNRVLRPWIPSRLLEEEVHDCGKLEDSS
jgi:hypothetical protein